MQYQIKLQDYESLAGRIDKVQEYVEKEKRRDVHQYIPNNIKSVTKK